jgi:uncharacterized protein
MLYAIMVNDRDGAEPARQAHRAGHLAHFRNHADRIALAGPLSADDGRSVGSLVIFDAESAEAAAAFIRADPFHDAGVWHEPVIMRFKATIFSPGMLTD